VAKLIEGSVAEAVAGETTVAVGFSGGLDSSILTKCAMSRVRVVACSAYSSRAGDALRAKRAAETLGVELVATELTRENVGDALAALDLPFEPTLMDRSLWCLYRLVAKSARDSGARVLLLGQLADELFGGYAKYAAASLADGEEAARAMMEADLKEYASRGRVRDLGACDGFVEARLPFESEGLVKYATSMPVSFKIADGVRKAVLRRAGAALGVPEELASAPKKAAQYSSGVQRLVATAHF